jgi:hypothetical protein
MTTSVQWELRCRMRTDGPTGMAKLKVVFRNFVKASKNQKNGRPRSHRHVTATE